MIIHPLKGAAYVLVASMAMPAALAHADAEHTLTLNVTAEIPPSFHVGWGSGSKPAYALLGATPNPTPSVALHYQSDGSFAPAPAKMLHLSSNDPGRAVVIALQAPAQLVHEAGDVTVPLRVLVRNYGRHQPLSLEGLRISGDTLFGTDHDATLAIVIDAGDQKYLDLRAGAYNGTVRFVIKQDT